MLLGSPPDMVHSHQLRETNSSTRNEAGLPYTIGPQFGDPPPLQRIVGAGHRYLPGWYGLISHLAFIIIA